MGWTALLHRGYEQSGQNGERPFCDKDIPQWTANNLRLRLSLHFFNLYNVTVCFSTLLLEPKHRRDSAKRIFQHLTFLSFCTNHLYVCAAKFGYISKVIYKVLLLCNS